MLFFDGGLALIALAVWVFCIIDVITTPDSETRNLPKLLWLMIVILLVDVGSIAWLVAGRNWIAKSGAVAARAEGLPVGTRQSGRAAGRANNPDDDDEFLAGLRARAEEQRRRARESEHRDEPPGPNPSS
jgi:hypothetical protein